MDASLHLGIKAGKHGLMTTWRCTASKSQEMSFERKVKPTGKVRVTIYWDCRGILLINFLDEQSTVNSAYYYHLLKKKAKHVHMKCDSYS